MKGSQKKFSRYLNSEYYDDYLDAPDDYDQEYDYEEQYSYLPNPPKSTNQAQTPNPPKEKPSDPAKKPVPKKSRQPEFKANFTLERTPLVNSQIKSFVNLLGQDAKNCYYNLREVQIPESVPYFDLYTKYETIPTVYLSVVPKEAVYLWQVNRLCPFQKATNHLVLDSKALNSETKLHLSLLLLAKIGNIADEEIMDAKFAGEGRVLVKSKQGQNQLVIRVYHVKSFFPIARINPFNLSVMGTDLYSSKLVIKGIDRIHEPYRLQVSLWNRKSADELNREMMAKFVEKNPPKPVEPEVLQPSAVDASEFPELKTTEDVNTTEMGLKNEMEPGLPEPFSIHDSAFPEIKPVEESKAAEPSPKDEPKPIEPEILVTIKDSEGLSKSFSVRDSSFSDIHTDSKGVISLCDKETSSVVCFADTTVFISHYEMGNLELIQLVNNELYFVNDEGGIYILDISLFPHVRLLDNKNDRPVIPVDSFPPDTLKDQLRIVPFYRTASIGYFLDHNFVFTATNMAAENAECETIIKVEKLPEKIRTFTWEVVGASGNPRTLMYIRDHFLHINEINYGLQNTKSIALPFEESDKQKTWQIIGEKGVVFLIGTFANKQAKIIEIHYSPEEIYEPDYVPEIIVLAPEDQKYKVPEFDSLKGQLGGPGNKIVFIGFDNEPYLCDPVNLVYKVPISLVNPLVVKKSENRVGAGEVDEDELKEERYLDKMNKIRNEVKHGKNKIGLDESNARMKEVREGIAAKLGDTMKFNDEYQRQQKQQSGGNNSNNGKNKENAKVMKEPKRVSRDQLELYNEIKTEKKNIVKTREKEKTQRKKDRAQRDDR